jgi:hypothetical protein
LVIVLMGALTYLCARPLRLDQATLSALLLSTQNEISRPLILARLELPDAAVRFAPHHIAQIS